MKVAVHPSDASLVTGATLRIVERNRYSGMIAKQAEFRLLQNGAGFGAEFEWDSTVNNSEQELSIQFDTTVADAPTTLLADPISRRRDFLSSFSSEA